MINIIDIASDIYDHYICNDDNQIQELLRSMIPIYSRHLRYIKFKYYYRWKILTQKLKPKIYSMSNSSSSSSLFHSFSQKSKSKHINFKDRMRKDHMTIQLAPMSTTTSSPKITSVKVSKRNKTIEEEKNAKSNLRCKKSMNKIFCKVNLAECCKVTFPEYTPTFRQFYSFRDVNQQYNTNRKGNINSTLQFNPPVKSIKRTSSQVMYLPDYSPKSNYEVTFNNKGYNFNNKILSKKTEKESKKTLSKTNDAYTINSNQLSYPSSYSHHNTKPQYVIPSQRHVNLQTLSDSKLLQLATHYITTDESLKKFQINNLK